MELQEAKQWIIEHATKLDACSSEKQRIKDSLSFDDICQVVKDNVNWVTSNGLFLETKIDNVIPTEFLSKHGIISGIENVGFCNTGKWNTGDWNTGDWNTGDCNTGKWNTGNCNTGNCNTGNCNTGDCNTGKWNTGDWNTGDCNTGKWNTGDWNTGNCNTGNCNTGDCNTGKWNTGDWNTGDRNTGLFNRDTPKLRIFEKDSEWTNNDWISSNAYRVSQKLITTEWIGESEMTNQEKIDNPLFYTQGGYLKKYSFKDACSNWWKTLNRIEKDSFKDVPNFNVKIFEEITGIKFHE